MYDLATTLLPELAYLTLVLDEKDLPAQGIRRPEHIFPSRVFRMAGMLQDELARLEAHSGRSANALAPDMANVALWSS